MSLINEMLKDLEARGETKRADAEIRTAPAPAPRATNRGLVALVATLVVLLGGTVAWIAIDPAQKTVAAPEPAIAPPVTAKTEATRESLATPAVEPRAAVIASTTPALVPPGAETESASAPPPLPASDVPEPAVAAVEVVEDAPRETETLIVRRHAPTPAEKAERAAREGFAALHRQDWSTAARLLGELVLLEPANDDAREGLVVALANQGRLAEADGVLLDGLAVGVEPARFAKLRARLLASENRIGEALESLAIAVPAVADDPEFHALRGALAQQAGDYALALRTYRGLVAYAPGNGTWLAGLAMALDHTGERAQALEAYGLARAAGGLEPALFEHAQKRLDALSGTKH